MNKNVARFVLVGLLFVLPASAAMACVEKGVKQPVPKPSTPSDESQSRFFPSWAKPLEAGRTQPLFEYRPAQPADELLRFPPHLLEPSSLQHS